MVILKMNNINIEELYWTDWDELAKETKEIDQIFSYIKDFPARSIKELAHILKLYSNPSGRFTIEFAKIIGEMYKYDKIKFIKALNLVKDEAINLVYLFRMQSLFEDEDREKDDILNSNKLSEEEIDTTNSFFKMYKTICAT